MPILFFKRHLQKKNLKKLEGASTATNNCTTTKNRRNSEENRSDKETILEKAYTASIKKEALQIILQHSLHCRNLLLSTLKLQMQGKPQHKNEN